MDGGRQQSAWEPQAAKPFPMAAPTETDPEPRGTAAGKVTQEAWAPEASRASTLLWDLALSSTLALVLAAATGIQLEQGFRVALVDPAAIARALVAGLVLLLGLRALPELSYGKLLEAEANLLTTVRGGIQHQWHRFTSRHGVQWHIHSLVLHNRTATPALGGPHRPIAVLLHGHSSGSALWESVLDRLADVADLAVIDLPGWGRSPAPPQLLAAHSPTRVTELHVDMLEGWLQAAGLSDRRVVLIGHSFGGFLATSFADRHPHKVEQLVLIAPAGLAPIMPEGAFLWGTYFRFWPPQRIARTLGRLGYLLFTTAYGATTTEDPRFVPYYYQLAYATTFTGAGDRAAATYLRFHIGGALWWATPILSKLMQFPGKVSIVWGQTDEMLPPVMGAVLHRIRPDTDLYYVKAGLHNPAHTNARATTDALIDAVLKHAGRPRASLIGRGDGRGFEGGDADRLLLPTAHVSSGLQPGSMVPPPSPALSPVWHPSAAGATGAAGGDGAAAAGHGLLFGPAGREVASELMDRPLLLSASGSRDELREAQGQLFLAPLVPPTLRHGGSSGDGAGLSIPAAVSSARSTASATGSVFTTTTSASGSGYGSSSFEYRSFDWGPRQGQGQGQAVHTTGGGKTSGGEAGHGHAHATGPLDVSGSFSEGGQWHGEQAQDGGSAGSEAREQHGDGASDRGMGGLDESGESGFGSPSSGSPLLRPMVQHGALSSSELGPASPAHYNQQHLPMADETAAELGSGSGAGQGVVRTSGPRGRLHPQHAFPHFHGGAASVSAAPSAGSGQEQGPASTAAAGRAPSTAPTTPTALAAPIGTDVISAEIGRGRGHCQNCLHAVHLHKSYWRCACAAWSFNAHVSAVRTRQHFACFLRFLDECYVFGTFNARTSPSIVLYLRPRTPLPEPLPGSASAQGGRHLQHGHGHGAGRHRSSSLASSISVSVSIPFAPGMQEAVSAVGDTVATVMLAAQTLITNGMEGRGPLSLAAVAGGSGGDGAAGAGAPSLGPDGTQQKQQEEKEDGPGPLAAPHAHGGAGWGKDSEGREPEVLPTGSSSSVRMQQGDTPARRLQARRSSDGNGDNSPSASALRLHAHGSGSSSGQWTPKPSCGQLEPTGLQLQPTSQVFLRGDVFLLD